MITHLLDVNMLLALSDPMHVHHDVVHHWFAEVGLESWATCPITENGFVRIASHPKYPNRPGNANLVLSLLRQFCTAEGHEFWAENISLRNLLLQDVALTHNQVTDLYLLGLAVHKEGKLATLDQHIPSMAIQGGAGALEVIFP
jgi:toxin-antitoxin system PIN domain toxin